MAGRTLNQYQKDLDDLEDALGTGALKVVYGDPPKQVTFRSVAGIREAIQVVQGNINKINKKRKPRKMHLTTARSGWQQ